MTNENGRPTAAIYCRVSSEEQGKKNHQAESLPAQEAKLSEYAQVKGFTVPAGLLVHEEHSGKDLYERSKFMDLLARAKRHEFSHFLVYNAKRFSRGGPTHGLIAASELTEAGVTIHFVTQQLVVSDLNAPGMADILLAILFKEGKQENTGRTQVFADVRRQRALSGRPIASSRPLYGYRWDLEDKEVKPDGTVRLRKSHLLENAETAWVVRRIFHELAAGKSMRAMCRGLNADHIPPPRAYAGVRGAGSDWSEPVVRRMVTQCSGYWGEWSAFASRRDRPSTRHKLPVEALVAVPGYAPALVDKDTALAAARRIGTNAEVNPRPPVAEKGTLLEGGFGRCGWCADAGKTHALQAWAYPYPRKDGTQRLVYRCWRSIKQGRDACRTSYIPVAAFDPPLYHLLSMYVFDPTLLREMARREATTTAQTATGQQREMLEKALTRAKQEEANQVRTLRDLTPTSRTYALVKADAEELGKHIEQLERDLAAVVAVEGAAAGRVGWYESIATEVEQAYAKFGVPPIPTDIRTLSVEHASTMRKMIRNIMRDLDMRVVVRYPMDEGANGRTRAKVNIYLQALGQPFLPSEGAQPVYFELQLPIRKS